MPSALKTAEDLKRRYYDIQRRLIIARADRDADAVADPALLRQFDYEYEVSEPTAHAHSLDGFSFRLFFPHACPRPDLKSLFPILMSHSCLSPASLPPD